MKKPRQHRIIIGALTFCNGRGAEYNDERQEHRARHRRAGIRPGSHGNFAQTCNKLEHCQTLVAIITKNCH